MQPPLNKLWKFQVGFKINNIIEYIIYMPPKKDKKLKPKKKATKKPRKIITIAMAPKNTAINREIPGGIIGTGGGGGTQPAGLVPASFLGAALAKQPPPATPIQTPDQFKILREQDAQARALANIIEEQKIARRGHMTDAEKAAELGITVEDIRADRASKKKTIQDEKLNQEWYDFLRTETEKEKKKFTPIEEVKLTEQIQTPTKPMEEMPVITEPAEIPASVTKVKVTRKKARKSAETPDESFGEARVKASEATPFNQQGLFTGVAGNIRGTVPPDPSTSLAGLDPIGEPDVFVTSGEQKYLMSENPDTME